MWHKDNLIISLFGSGHPDQYSYEIPHEYLPRWENLLEKIIRTKREHYFPYRMSSKFF